MANNTTHSIMVGDKTYIVTSLENTTIYGSYIVSIDGVNWYIAYGTGGNRYGGKYRLEFIFRNAVNINNKKHIIIENTELLINDECIIENEKLLINAAINSFINEIK